jgi:3-oxoacyl-[acyl-carrier protein] reductase
VSDRYARLVNAPIAGPIARRVGLPQPVRLERHRPGDPALRGLALLGTAPGGRLAQAVAEVLAQAGVDTATETPSDQRFKALVFDASAIADSTELVELQSFFHPTVGLLERCGRVIVLGTAPAACATPRAATAQRALEGFTRSLGKELGGRGVTVQLVYVAPGAEDELASTLRFLLSPRSAYVSGQVIRVGEPPRVDTPAGRDRAVGDAPSSDAPSSDAASSDAASSDAAPSVAAPSEIDWEQPLAGRVALVTGASRGIGAAIAQTLAREGARVAGLDVPALGDELRAAMQPLGGSAIGLDITSPEAPAAIVERFPEGLDVLVHNAGVTRDRTLAKMPAERWSELMAINLSSEERINDALLGAGALRAGGRIVCVSSMSGIAGNSGQTNYATSKAGVIGMVQALAPLLTDGQTINAVAPGFIETQMTAKMPIAIREAGRRMSSLAQGGLPIDVAETIAWFAHPASGAVNGNVVRVCGQNLLGA